jgi:hypothetical protein
MNKQTNPETSDENLNMQNSAQEAGAEEQQPIVKRLRKRQKPKSPNPKASAKKAAEAKETIYQDIAELDKLEQEYSQQEYETLTKLYEKKPCPIFLSGKLWLAKSWPSMTRKFRSTSASSRKEQFRLKNLPIPAM